MTSLYNINLNSHSVCKMKKQTGAAVLIIVIILLVAAVLSFIYASGNSMMQQKTSTNQYANNQAFEAAEAGLEFGLVYLNSNSSTIQATASGGYINYGPTNTTITNVILTNSSKYSIVYTNPTQSTYNLILIKSTGTSADGTATRIVQQEVYQMPSYVNDSLVSGGNVTLIGGSTLTNTVNNLNIVSGGTVTINNGGATYTSSGQTSYQGHFGTDIQQSVAADQGITESAFFQNVFGTPEATELSTVQAAGNYYSNSGPDYSQALNGKQGTTIWISQTNGSTVTLGQGVTIGSLLNPVTLIVEGDLNIANGVTIYGFVYSSGPVNGLVLAGGARIYGGMASAGITNISNGVQVVYTKYPLVAGSGSSGSYAKVPGSWKDF